MPDGSGERKDRGRGHVTGLDSDDGKFLTPSLRNCYDTAPYFHDGSMPSLRNVIRHFASDAATSDPQHDPITEPKVTLSDAEVKSLVAFLRALRGEAVPFARIAPPESFP